MTSPLEDEAMKKAFAEGSDKLTQLHKQLQNCKVQIHKRDRNSRVSDLVVHQLQKLSDQQANNKEELVTYKSVGKCFMCVPLKILNEELTKGSEKDRRDVNVLEKTKDYLEKNIADIETTLKELLQRRQLE